MKLLSLIQEAIYDKKNSFTITQDTDVIFEFWHSDHSYHRALNRNDYEKSEKDKRPISDEELGELLLKIKNSLINNFKEGVIKLSTNRNSITQDPFTFRVRSKSSTIIMLMKLFKLSNKRYQFVIITIRRNSLDKGREQQDIIVEEQQHLSKDLLHPIIPDQTISIPIRYKFIINQNILDLLSKERNGNEIKEEIKTIFKNNEKDFFGKFNYGTLISGTTGLLSFDQNKEIKYNILVTGPFSFTIEATNFV